jgi:acetyl esterase/lipase
MTGPFILLVVAMSSTFAAQFYPHAKERPRSPVEVFFHGGYWFNSLTRTGRGLLAAGWIAAIVALFWGLSVLGAFRWQ